MVLRLPLAFALFLLLSGCNGDSSPLVPGPTPSNPNQFIGVDGMNGSFTTFQSTGGGPALGAGTVRGRLERLEQNANGLSGQIGVINCLSADLTIWLSTGPNVSGVGSGPVRNPNPTWTIPPTCEPVSVNWVGGSMQRFFFIEGSAGPAGQVVYYMWTRAVIASS